MPAKPRESIVSTLSRSSIMQILHPLHGGRHRVDPVSSAPHYSSRFERFSMWAVRATGGHWAFRVAVLLILAWAATGPIFRYHESWKTTFTVVTSSVTFLLVFLIQNAQNRESKALHLKLDELIYASKNARNELINIEHLTEEQLDRLGRRYSRLAKHFQNQKALIMVVGEAIPGESEAQGIFDRCELISLKDEVRPTES
jgi:low affinity Fe/Cu permease